MRGPSKRPGRKRSVDLGDAWVGEWVGGRGLGECSNAVRGVGDEEEERRGIVWRMPGRGGGRE